MRKLALIIRGNNSKCPRGTQQRQNRLLITGTRQHRMDVHTMKGEQRCQVK